MANARKRKAAKPAKPPPKSIASERGLALLGEALENPADDAPRLVYADWLEEQGHPFADVIRLQCAAATGHEAKVDALVREHRAAWIAPIAEWTTSQFERGMLARIYGPTSKYVQKATQDALLPALSLFGAHLTVLRGPSVKLPGAATLAWTSALRWYDCQARDNVIADLARSPHVARLSSLTLEKVRCTDDGLLALATSKHLTRVRHFGLPSPVHLGAFTVAGIQEILERWPIESLDLGGLNSLKIDQLVSLPAMARLRRLEIAISPHHVAQLTSSTQLTSLEHLLIDTYGAIPDEAFELLLDNPAFGRLQGLSLRTLGHEVGPAVLPRLRARFGDQLKTRA